MKTQLISTNYEFTLPIFQVQEYLKNTNPVTEDYNNMVRIRDGAVAEFEKYTNKHIAEKIYSYTFTDNEFEYTIAVSNYQSLLEISLDETIYDLNEFTITATDNSAYDIKTDVSIESVNDLLFNLIKIKTAPDGIESEIILALLANIASKYSSPENPQTPQYTKEIYRKYKQFNLF